MAEGRSSKLADKITDYLFQVALYAEVLLAALLLVLVIFGIGFFVLRIVTSVSQHVVLSPTVIRNELDIVLVIFIIIELFRIAVAYYQKKQVLSTVIEAAFVAIARKLVLFDFPVEGLNGAIALSLLMISIGLSYFLIRYISNNVKDL